MYLYIAVHLQHITLIAFCEGLLHFTPVLPHFPTLPIGNSMAAALILEWCNLHQGNKPIPNLSTFFLHNTVQ